MPDPDLPPVELEEGYIREVEQSMPQLPDDYRVILSTIGIDGKTTEDIIAAPATAQTVARIYDTAGAEHAKRVAFWLLQPQADDVETNDDAVSKGSDEQLIALSQMVADNKLSSTAAKEVLAELLKTGDDPAKIAEAKNLLQVSDEGAIAAIVEQVLAANEQAANDVKNGEMKAIGFLVGQVMKASQGKANPALAQELIKKQLGL
jgi:aspartyl-tRNA(Asn)/glutamyl-tRNA(Gln) amidotransferase subunit B